MLCRRLRLPAWCEPRQFQKRRFPSSRRHAPGGTFQALEGSHHLRQRSSTLGVSG